MSVVPVRSVLRAFVCAVVVAGCVPAGAQAAILTVNSSNLTVDGTGCDAAHCSLPEAINAANAANDPDTIVFSGVSSITVSSGALPVITQPVAIVGAGGGSSNCGGVPQVTLLGHSGAVGLQFDDGSDGSNVCRMTIGNFNTGISVSAGADGVTVSRNALGHNGVTALPQSFGITTSANTTITSNVISGNTVAGVSISAGAGAATVTANRIGTNLTGTAAIPNGQGVSTSSPGAVIGSTAGPPNVISGNSGNGVVADAGTIIGNYIGTDVDGDAPLPNGAGVNLPAGSTARVGGPAPGERNVISGNTSGPGIRLFSGAATVQGNYLGTDPTGNVAVPNREGISVRENSGGAVIGGTDPSEGNLISGNTDGIATEATAPTSGLRIEGNTIGLDVDREDEVPNTQDGIKVNANHSDVTIGGTASGAGNRIGGNGNDGIETKGDAVTVAQNTIGRTISAATPNIGYGVRVLAGTEGIAIGGPTAAARNVISGNGDGILIGQDTVDAVVRGNHIGVDADGTTDRGNGGEGLRIDKATDAVVGGTQPGDANVISGNDGYGVVIIGGVSQAPVVEGNRIGTDTTGQLARGNDQGGILLADSANARVGGTTAAARNVIAANDGPGLDVQTGVVGAQVHGNLIGVAADGVTPLGNSGPGVFIRQVGAAFTLGGTAAGTGNVIRHNDGDGVQVGSSSPTDDGARQNAILGNTIADNGAASATEIGIDLVNDGVTANDAGDGDNGENALQNFPVLTGASTDGTQTTVAGTVDTTAGNRIRIEVFSGASCDPSGHGQGETFLGATEVTAGAGATPFTATVAAADASRVITTTATDLTTNETSEFSACQTITFIPPPSPIVNGPASPLLPEPPTAPAAGVQATVTPKLPAKLKVRRAGIDDGVLDLLVEITSAAATSGAQLELDYESSGRHTKFSVPITTTTKAAGGEALLKIRKKLPSSQPKDTGIVEIAYAGNATVAPDEVRLRAADVQAKLVRSSSTLTGGRLKVSGTISSKARGVVRLRLGYTETSGAAAFQSFNVTIKNGRWSLDRQLTGTAAAGGYLSIQFTGYEAAGMRGEQTGKQLP